jgi:ATP-dependent DNA helicase DinG
MPLKELVNKMAQQGLRQRPSQVDMLENVYQAVKARHILCVEAPTGTGKTLAYCLGALTAKENKQVLIISTATTALQEQFFQKDLLLIEKILQEKLTVVLAKGRRRYVCHARLFKPDQFFDDNHFADEMQALQQLIEDKKWQGELDHAPAPINSELWQKISTDSNGCSAGKCEYFNECAFYQNRRQMYQADIIVTNHSLLLSDLELGGGVILPDMKESIYILDECHHLPEKALSHFAKQAAVIRSLDWINLIGKTVAKATGYIKFNQKSSDELNHHIKELVEAIRQAKTFVDWQSDLFIEKQWRIKILDNKLAEIAKLIIYYAEKTTAVIEVLAKHLASAYESAMSAQEKAKAEAITRLQASLSFILDRSVNLEATWRDLLQLADQNAQIPYACWFEMHDTRDGGDFTLHTSPINVSKAMQDLLWDKVENGAVLCSATIRAMGKFEDFLRKLGLKDNAKITEKVLVSPFEYQHSLLFVPQMQTEPSQMQQEKHLDEILSMLPKLMFSQHGTLVLFTSRKAMEYVLQRAPAEFKPDILSQQSLSKMELIKQHKQKVDQGQRSIIFGLASFAEGIDLPSLYCEHVIIQKIPFTVPSDPISQTRSEWLKKYQKDPFQLVTLPETSIKLAQYIGRLLRHEDDRGVVTILDKRLYSKNYGAALLATLPGFTRLVNVSLEKFLQHEAVMAL